MTRQSLDLTLELLSPCFLGGAHQEPEFRIASLRGLWRYWYRALYGEGIETRPSEGEKTLFGSAPDARHVGGRTEGRSRVRLVPVTPLSTLRGSTTPWPRADRRQATGKDYLLYTMGMNDRRYLEPGQSIQLRLMCDGVEVDKPCRSLAAACAFSGLGARSRRMAGALALTLARGDGPVVAASPAKDPDELAARLVALLAGARKPLHPERPPARPAFHVVGQSLSLPGRGGQDSQWFSAGVLKRDYPNWGSALDAVGKAFSDFRRTLTADSELARRVGSGDAQPPQGRTIMRAAFGLPLTFRSGGRVSASVRPPTTDRRGSPMFLTLEQLAGDRLAVVWCLFRARLTLDDHMRVGSTPWPAPDFSVIDQMLKEPFWASHRIA